MKPAVLLLYLPVGLASPPFSQSWCGTPYNTNRIPVSSYATQSPRGVNGAL